MARAQKLPENGNLLIYVFNDAILGSWMIKVKLIDGFSSGTELIIRLLIYIRLLIIVRSVEISNELRDQVNSRMSSTEVTTDMIVHTTFLTLVSLLQMIPTS